MPELPDIEVFCYNLKKQYAGKKLLRIKIVNGKKLKDSQAAFTKALAGRYLEDVYRSGKEFRFKFSGNVLLGLHLMLTGDIKLLESVNSDKSTIAEFYFEEAPALALTDRMKNAHIRLNPEDKDGIDALSKELTFSKFKNLLQRKTAVKNILLDQNVIRGIGNGYSDEILWEAKISPYSIAEKIPDEQIKVLLKCIKKVLTTATKKILKEYPGLITGEIKEFLKIHTKKHTHSPSGKPIIIDEKGMRKTYYTVEQKLYK